MQVIQAHNISHQFDNGDVLFHNLTCTVDRGVTGLIGRNGAGKSILMSILSGDRAPQTGAVKINASVAIYHQESAHRLDGNESVAALLGVDKVLQALEHVESGDLAEKWYEIIGDNWAVKTWLENVFNDLGLPNDPAYPCQQLSGGQLAKLRLWQLFECNADVLFLDEPSNHMDETGKNWLIEKIRHYSGHIVLASHDRALLAEVDQIWHLSNLGLRIFCGNYAAFKRQHDAEQQSLARQISALEKDKKKLALQVQRNREKANQRAKQGKKQRLSSSQSKISLDFKKDKADTHSSSRNKHEQQKRDKLNAQTDLLIAKCEKANAQQIYMSNKQAVSEKNIVIENGVLAFGSQQPLNLKINTRDRLHLVGHNGVGKSTLMKTIAGDLSLQQGNLRAKVPFAYLDQHCSKVNTSATVLENLLCECKDMLQEQARTLLAGIGFRKDRVNQLAQHLSGGEKMKLVMLMVSHQPTKPFLLLDEPDNHLDLDSKWVLADTLKHYMGGFILVSHDRQFVQDTGVSRQIDIETIILA